MDGIKSFYQQQNIVEISQENIEKFANSFKDCYSDYLEKISPLKVPLNFQDSLEEFNFFSLYHLLSVGSMFSHRSIEANQTKLSDIVLYGIFGAYIEHPKLDTTFMKTMIPSDIGQVFSLPLTDKSDVLNENGVAYAVIEKRGGLIQLAELYSNIFIYSANEIEKRGYNSISSLLLSVISNNCDTSTNLERVCRELSSIFPHLDDRHFVSIQSSSSSSTATTTTTTSSSINNNDNSLDVSLENMSELPFFTTIRRLLFDICNRFNENNNNNNINYSIPGIRIEGLDNLIAAPSIHTINALFQLNIIIPSQSAKDLIDSSSSDSLGTELLIRSSSILACHLISEEINRIHKLNISPLALSIYLDNLDQNLSQPSFIPRKSGLKW